MFVGIESLAKLRFVEQVVAAQTQSIRGTSRNWFGRGHTVDTCRAGRRLSIAHFLNGIVLRDYFSRLLDGVNWGN